jgi:nucleoside-diphosphate-sugar epimerase
MKQIQIEMLNEDCKKSCVDYKSLLPLKNQKILITGGTGFIGKWICEMVSFLNTNFDFNTHLYLIGRDVESFSNDAPHLAKKTFISLIEQDVKNLHDLPNDVNWVIHAAASPDSRVHVSQPLKTIETIYRGTNLVLDYCFRLPQLNKIVHLSSNQVYGKIEGEKLIREDMCGGMESTKFSNIYGEAKRISESICSVYRNQNSLPIVVCRPFSFIGPYQHLDKPWAINNFIRDGLLGGPIRILGNGKIIRSYLYGSDLAYWLLTVLVKGEIGEIYNIGSSESVTLNELSKRIKSFVSSNIEISYKSSKDEYHTSLSTIPDLSKIKSKLKVQEKFSLDESIFQTIAWNKINITTKTEK